MLSGKPPFAGESFEVLKANVLALHYASAPMEGPTSSAAHRVVRSMLQVMT